MISVRKLLEDFLGDNILVRVALQCYTGRWALMIVSCEYLNFKGINDLLTFLGVKTPVLNFLNFLSNLALLSYKPLFL